MRNYIILSILLFSSGLFAQNDSIPTGEIKSNSKNIQELSNEVENLTNNLASYSGSLENVSGEIGELQSNFEQVYNQVSNQNKLQRSLESQIRNQKQIISDLRVSNAELQGRIDSLFQITTYNYQTIEESSNQLGARLDESSKVVETNFKRVDDNLSRNQLLWIIAILGFLIMAGLIFFLLNKKLKTSRIDIETQINKTSIKIEEETVRLDKKIVELLDSQLRLEKETKANDSLPNPASNSNGQDHKLALKVADEIIRIQKNLSRMDENTKGLKQLAASVKRIQSNFASNGYELVEMLGKEYHEGMKASVNFVQDEDYPDDKKVITRIIKPQVNYKGEMIQPAQIEVTEA